MLALIAAAVFAPQGPGPSPAPVVINEFAYDDQGTDDKEFVELFNRTNAPVDLGGWQLQCIEGNSPGGVNSSFTIPNGTVIPANGFVVIGTATVPNLTPGLNVAVNWLENTADADGLVLFDAALQPVDSVIWCFSRWTAPVPTYAELPGLNGRAFAQDVAGNPSFQTTGRRIDGYDSNNNGADFAQMVWTPGASNAGPNTTAVDTQYSFDLVVGTQPTNDFSSSFSPPVVAAAPSIPVSGATTLALPASPQGGNVLVLHDRTGGGNLHQLRVTVAEDLLLECWVHVFGGNPAIGATEGESWAIGIGTSDVYAAPVDVPGTYYAATSSCTALGNREPGANGVAWMAFQTNVDTRLYFVDLNDGGAGFTVLGGPIVVTPGVDDGWQRLRIRASGNEVVANFGGTFGRDDGTSIHATRSQRIAGQPYFQFRECVIANANIRPLVVDHLAVYGIVTGSIAFAGTGSPVAAGLPTIATTGGSPTLGTPTFAITGTTFGSSTLAGLLVTIGGVMPFGVQIPGAQPGCELWVGLPADLFGIAVSDVTGNATYALPLPADNVFAGVQVGLQWLVADATLPYSLQIGSSRGMQITIGN